MLHADTTISGLNTSISSILPSLLFALKMVGILQGNYVFVYILLQDYQKDSKDHKVR